MKPEKLNRPEKPERRERPEGMVQYRPFGTCRNCSIVRQSVWRTCRSERGEDGILPKANSQWLIAKKGGKMGKIIFFAFVSFVVLVNLCFGQEGLLKTEAKPSLIWDFQKFKSLYLV